MNRLLVAATAAALLIPGVSGLAAQNSDSDRIDTKIVVVQALRVDGMADLLFGSVLAGTTVTIRPSDANAGRFEVIGAPGAEIFAQITEIDRTLDRDGGPETLTLSVDAAYNDFNNPSAAIPVDLGGDGTAVRFSASGRLYLWIGGTIVVPEGQPADQYDGDIELTATYTGN